MEENDDPNAWWGPFYYNPTDSRFMVPKRLGFGWTLNFAHTGTKILMAFVIISITLAYELKRGT